MKRDIKIDGQPDNKVGLQKLRVGVLGTGFMGGTHTFAWKNAKAFFNWPIEIELKALFDPDQDELDLHGNRFGFERTTTNWREICEADDIDVVSICTPNFAHKEMAEVAAANGKHIWCEKPMATSVEDAQAMVEAAKKAGVKTMLGYNYMKSPAILAIKKLISEGRIGEIHHFNGVYQEDFMSDPNMPFGWRLTKKGGGKGALGDMGSHQISMAIWLCGEIKELAARVQTIYPQRKDPETGEMRTVEVDDQYSAIGTFENGALFTMHTSWNGQGHKMNLGFEVTGTKGSIKFDQERMGEFQLFEMHGNKELATNGYKTILVGPWHPPYGNLCPGPGPHLGFNEMKVIEANHFVTAILEDGSCYPSFEDGLVYERTFQAVQDSSESRAWVTL